MEINDYASVFDEEIRDLALVGGRSKAQSFLEAGLDRIVDFGDIDSFDIIETDHKGDTIAAVQAYYFNILFGELTLFVNLYADMLPNELKNLTTSDIKPAFSKVRKYLKSVLSTSALEPQQDKCDAYRFKAELLNSRVNIKKIKIVFLTNKPLSRRYEHSDHGAIDGKEISVGIWDLKRFFEAEKSGQEREDIVVNFESSPLEALEASHSKHLVSYLVVMPGAILAEIYAKYKSRVLEQNVRSFLQNRSKVNKGIKLSIKENPDRFFAYNNGITATAKSVILDDNGNIIELENLQIVNGGQTTAQIYNASVESLDLSAVSVQMKLNIVSDLELTNTLVPNIARFANSQNPVSDADLFSNSPFHQKVEELSRRISPPVILGNAISEKWFYERSRGQYLNEQSHMTLAQRRDFQKSNPKNKMLTKTDLALIVNAWNMLPNHVSKGAQANFKVFANSAIATKNAAELNEHFFKEVVAKAIIFRALRKEIPKQSWYCGFPANIVAYSIAWLAFSMEQKEVSLDIDGIWKSQTAPDLVIELLLGVSESVNRHLQSHAGNPTTYAKSEQCWKDVKSSFDVLDVSVFNGVFADKVIADKKRNEANKEQDALNELMSEVSLLSVAPDCWDRVAAFMGNKMSASKFHDIEKLKRGEFIPEFKIRQLAKFVREYQKAGGEITFRADRSFRRENL